MQYAEVWPPAEAKPANAAEWANLPEDSPWSTERWLVELDAQVRDDLAAVDDTRLTDLAEQWAQIQEFGSRRMPAGDALSLIKDLVGLARRARDSSDQLYCFMSL